MGWIPSKDELKESSSGSKISDKSWIKASLDGIAILLYFVLKKQSNYKSTILVNIYFIARKSNASLRYSGVMESYAENSQDVRQDKL